MRRAAPTRRRFRAAALLVIVIAGGLSPWSPLREHVVEAGSTTRVQAGTEIVSATGDVTVTMAAASTAGNLLVAVVSNGGTSSSLPYSGPAGWVLATGTWQSGVGRAEIWYYPTNPGGVTSAAFTSSTTSIGAVGQISEWSGAATSGSLTGRCRQCGECHVAHGLDKRLHHGRRRPRDHRLSHRRRRGQLHSRGQLDARFHHRPQGGHGLQAEPGHGRGQRSGDGADDRRMAWGRGCLQALQQPGPVRTLSAVAGADKATISWTAPATGGAVSSYVVTALAGGLSPRNATAIPGTSTSVILSGLTGAAAYKFAVYGINAFGNSATVTTAASVTPTGGTHPYASEVLGDSPSLYFRLDEAAARPLSIRRVTQARARKSAPRRRRRPARSRRTPTQP